VSNRRRRFLKFIDWYKYFQCSGSGPFWSDPDPDVWDQIRALINDTFVTFLVFVVNFLAHEDTFYSIISQKKFKKKVNRKFVKARIRIRTFSKVGSGSATLNISSVEVNLRQFEFICFSKF
jgi:hypothetical protein